MQFGRTSNEQNVLKGVVSGVIAGLAATFVMSQVQTLLLKVTGQEKGKNGSPSSNARGKNKNPEGNLKTESHEAEPATEKVASAIAENVLHFDLKKRGKKAAGEAVHYAMGAASAAVYGGLAELMPEVTTARGVAFGAAVWVVADEALMPALGLAKPPTEYPFSTHACALASHMVYGFTTDIVRRALREVL
jgi:putative membrane protein